MWFFFSEHPSMMIFFDCWREVMISRRHATALSGSGLNLPGQTLARRAARARTSGKRRLHPGPNRGFRGKMIIGTTTTPPPAIINNTSNIHINNRNSECYIIRASLFDGDGETWHPEPRNVLLWQFEAKSESSPVQLLSSWWSHPPTAWRYLVRIGRGFISIPLRMTGPGVDKDIPEINLSW